MSFWYNLVRKKMKKALLIILLVIAIASPLMYLAASDVFQPKHTVSAKGNITDTEKEGLGLVNPSYFAVHACPFAV